MQKKMGLMQGNPILMALLMLLYLGVIIGGIVYVFIDVGGAFG